MKTQNQTSVLLEMKCEVCKKEGLLSILHPSSYARTTLLSNKMFYDEEGRRHIHSNNTQTQDFNCSKGHAFEITSKKRYWCGWGDDHQEIKVKEGTGIKSGIVNL